MNLNAPQQIDVVLRALKPWAVINAAGYVRVDDAEDDCDNCVATNAEGPANLARACAEKGIPLLTFSSDLVFGGTKNQPYVESDAASPLNVYGQSKQQAEESVLKIHPDALVVRTSAFFGPWDEHNFVAHAIRTLEAGGPLEALSDAVVSPTYVPHLVDSCLELLLDGAKGIHHVCNAGEISWYDWARRIARRAGFSEDLVVPRTQAEMNLPARRPSYCAMTSERGLILPSFEEAMDQYFKATRRARTAV
jgi:dTDP-4-dehydrorhamnose reductase